MSNLVRFPQPRPLLRTVTLALVVVTGLAASGCREQPAAETPESESSTSAVGGGSVVVFGTVTSTDGLPMVITLAPNPPREFEATQEASVLDHSGEAFKPATLLATIGQQVTIRIPEERTPHVLRITDSAGKVVSEAKTGALLHRFTEDGLYTVSCELHRYPKAQIRVTATPYAVVAGPDGSFRIPNVPAGAYTITAHEGESWIQASVKAEPPTTEVNLEAH